METETTIWSEFPNGGKAIVKQILASKEINKSKRAAQSGTQVGKWVHQVYQFHQNMLASPYVECFKVSKDKNTLADGLIERTSAMLDDIKSKTVHTVSEVKPVENISKNSHSFLVISLVQKEVLLSHKLRDHAYEY